MELSTKLGYSCGPGGTSVPVDGDYIVRPIYNLSGMGVGARRMQLKKNDFRSVGPGEFWCEYFHGPTITIDYEWDMIDDIKVLRPIFAAQGVCTSANLYRFNAWKKIDPPFWKLPKWINKLDDVPKFNIEFKYDRIIEIHLRPGCDFPKGATELIPVWSDMHDSELDTFKRMGFEMHTNFDDADGHLEVKRLGFLAR